MYDKIKIFFNKMLSLVLKDKKKEFVPKYEIGDVVYAYMPLNNVPKGHERRPCLIADIDYEKGIYKVFLFTSDIKKRKGASALVYYNNDNERVSCVVTRGLWDLIDENIINFIYKMDDVNSLIVAKKMLTSNKEEIKNSSFLEKYKDKIVPLRGDIIKINNYEYYVYEKNSECKYYLMDVYDSSDYIPDDIVKNSIFVRNKYIDVSSLELRDLEGFEYSYEKILFNTDCVLIEEERKKYKLNEKNKKKYEKMSNNGQNKVKNKNKEFDAKDVNTINSVLNYGSSLVPGSVVEIKDKTYLFLFTDEILQLNYYVDLYSIGVSYNCITSFSAYENSKVVNVLSDSEFLKVLKKIRPYLKYIDDDRAVARLRKMCFKG